MRAALALGGGTALGLTTQVEGAFALPPTSAAGVIALARGYMGMTLNEMKPLTEAPWTSYSDHWCAWFVSWCLRGLGYGRRTYATDFNNVFPAVAVPQVGDVVVFGTSHIGFVSQVTGSGWMQLDGNRVRPGTSAPLTTRVYEGVPMTSPTPIVFRRPPYFGSDIIEGDSMVLFRRAADGRCGLFTDTDYTPVPSGAQATTAFNLYHRQYEANGYTPVWEGVRGCTVTNADFDWLIASVEARRLKLEAQQVALIEALLNPAP